MKYITILVASLILAACGGGGSDEPEQQPTQPDCPINLAYASWGGCVTTNEAMKGVRP